MTTAGVSGQIGVGQAGRAVAEVRGSELSVERLRALGWNVDDLDIDLLIPYRAFPSLEDARATASADLPPGTTVNWTTKDGTLGGGFIVGYDQLAPPLAGIVPAYVLWPDGSQDFVEGVGELVSVLRQRLDWLVDLAHAAMFPAVEIDAGRAAALRALQVLAVDGRLTPECCGPLYDVRCAANVEPIGRLRWDGFSEGWNEPDGPPSSQRRHPVQYDYGGDFQQAWRDAVEEGVSARRRSLT
jgi:hypothetical protein